MEGPTCCHLNEKGQMDCPESPMFCKKHSRLQEGIRCVHGVVTEEGMCHDCYRQSDDAYDAWRVP